MTDAVQQLNDMMVNPFFSTVAIEAAKCPILSCGDKKPRFLRFLKLWIGTAKRLVYRTSFVAFYFRFA